MKTSYGRIALLACIVFAILLAGTALAEESSGESGAEKAAVQADYSDGFRKFYKLGLPDVKDAEYVNLSVYSSTLNIDHHSFYSLDLEGNAWLLEKNDSGPSKFVSSKSRILEVYDLQSLREIIKQEREEEGGDGDESTAVTNPYSYEDEKGRVGGDWKEADLKKDIEATIEFLEKEKNDENQYSSFGHGSGAGGMFLSAIHYYSKGYKEEANRIVQLLFDISGDRRKVILQALNAMADNEYEDLMFRFVCDKDFSKFSRDLTQLLQKYRVGWRKGLSVKMVLDDVNRRLASQEPPRIEGLDAENAALAGELAELGSKSQGLDRNAYRGARTLWFLNSGKRSGDANDEDEELNALAKIRRRGVDSVPLLLALLDDDYLTALDSWKMGGISRSSYGWDMKLTEEMVKEHYLSMWRPLTRGDIAHRLLNYIPISSGDQSYGFERKDKDELRMLCEEWYQENKDKTAIELARLYLGSSNSSQQSDALSYLIRYGNSNDFVKVEEQLLESPGDYRSLNLIQGYVNYRGAEAKDFVDKYAEAMESPSEDGMFKNGDNNDYAKRLIERLKKIVDAPPPEDLLADIVAGRKQLAEEEDMVMRGLAKKMTSNELVDTLLQAAVDAEDVDLRSGLIKLCQSAQRVSMYSRYYQSVGGVDEGEDEEPKLADHLDKWKILIEDERVPRMGRPQQISIADSGAYAMENLYGDSSDDLYTKLYILDEELYSILLARAQERLAGKDGDQLTPMPSADNIDDDRLGELIDTLKTAEGDELLEFARGLNNDELLALSQEELDADLQKRLAPYSLKIESVFTDIGDPQAVERVAALKGRELDTALVKEIKQICSESVAPGRMVQLNVFRDSALGGVMLTLYDFDSETPEYQSQMEDMADEFTASDGSIVKGYLRGGNLFAVAQWQEGGGSDSDAAASDSGSDDMLDDLLADEMDSLDNESEQMEEAAKKEFWDSVDSFIAGDCDVWRGGAIYFTAVPAPSGDE